MSCLLCQAVVHELDRFASNQSSVARVIAGLQQDCGTLFNHTLREACDALANDAVELLPFIDRELSSLAWDDEGVCAALGKCEVPCCKSDAPEQVHLALRPSPHEMTVMWTTRDAGPAVSVWWGGSSSALTHSASELGPPLTYTHFGWRGYLHSATLTGLEPNRTYFYRVGSASSQPVHSFRTLAMGAGGATTPLRIVVIGDMGYGPMSDATVAEVTRRVEAAEVDLVLHNGDVSYADGEMKHWDTFLRKIEPIASRVPYLTTPGNHEFWFNFSAYRARFGLHMPNAAPNDGMYWSAPLANGTVHLTAMDTESPLDVARVDARQQAWLQNDLAAARQARPAWTIAAGHRPLYCSTHHGQDIPHGNSVLRVAVEETLITSKVDLVLQAHVHAYERSLPLAHGAPTQTGYDAPTAPVYVLQGASGNREKNELPPGDEPWSAAQASNVSFGLLTIRARSLRYEQIDSASGETIDSFTITK